MKSTIYQQLSQNLRASDEISFKLLGLLPLATLLSFIGIFVKESFSWSPYYFLFGVMGSLLVWGIFRWELRETGALSTQAVFYNFFAILIISATLISCFSRLKLKEENKKE